MFMPLAKEFMSKQRRTQEERSEATRAALLAAARELFVERGYTNVSTNEIVAMAGVTRGALYHHFPSGKSDLFRSLLEQLEAELDVQIRARVTDAFDEGAHPIQAAVLGLDPYFNLVGDPGLARMILIDAPSVLGATGWRDIDAVWGVKQFGDLITLFIDLEIYEAQPIEPLASMLYGAAAETALYLAGAEEKTTARRLVHDTWCRLLLGLAAPAIRDGRDHRWSWDKSAHVNHPPVDRRSLAPT
jgi:AcrR family transcriptional regulator